MRNVACFTVISVIAWCDVLDPVIEWRRETHDVLRMYYRNANKNDGGTRVRANTRQLPLLQV